MIVVQAIKTPHSHPDFKKVKLSVRTLLSSDAFWKGLGCTGNAWTRRGRLHDDDEWSDFVNLCKGELVKIGDAYVELRQLSPVCNVSIDHSVFFSCCMLLCTKLQGVLHRPEFGREGWSPWF